MGGLLRGCLCTRAVVEGWAGEEAMSWLCRDRRAIFRGSWWCVDVVR